MSIIIAIVTLLVIVAIGVGSYFLYQGLKKGMTSNASEYLVSTRLNLNLNDISTLESIVNTWKDSFLFNLKSSKETVVGNEGVDDNLYKNAKMSVTVGEYGIVHSFILSTVEQKVTLFKSGTKSIVMIIKLKDDTKMSDVLYDIVLEGCPSGITDFTIEELKKTPSVLYIKWYTTNKIAQGLGWTIKPLFNGADVSDKIPIISLGTDGNNADQHLDISLNLLD